MGWLAPIPVGLPKLIAFASVMVAGALALLINLARNRQFGDAAARSRPSSLGILLEGIAFFIVGFGRVEPVLPWNSPRALVGTAAVLILGFGAVALFAASVRTMGRNWSVVARTRSDHELVKTGPFAVVRHPIYLALLLYFVCLAVALGHPGQLLIAAPLYLLGTTIRVQSEEKLLRAQFGEEHARYVRDVPALIPFLR